VTTDRPTGQERRSPIVGVSLKMYFDTYRTHRWIAEVVDAVTDRTLVRAVDIFVAPGFVELAQAHGQLAGSGIRLCAQNAAAEAAGAFTGEVSPLSLAQVGCELVELGHAERRRLAGETNETVARKARAAAEAGLVPVVCVGEPDNVGADAAVEHCGQQLSAVWDAVAPHVELLVAYEPVWAIGQPEPAPADHVAAVVRGLRVHAADRDRPIRVIYGGSAGIGTYTGLRDDVDGLFLGRFAHDVDSLVAILAEVAAGPGNAVEPAPPAVSWRMLRP